MADLIFFHQKKCNYYLGNYQNNQKYCGVKMRELKNQMLATMVPPPPYAVKC